MSTNYIDQITDTAGTTHDISEGDSTRIFRATCSTAAGTTAKVATLQTSSRNFSLATGVRVAVTFTYGNSATTPTLNVNSTGAKTIATPTAVATLTTGNGTTYNTWGPYETVIFTYNGTYWVKSGSSLGAYTGQPISIATSTSTNQITLAHGTKYSLNVGGNSYIFTTPTDNNSGGTITEVKTNEGAHTTIDATSGKAEFNIPTKTSHLTNDSGFITTDSDKALQIDSITSGTTYYPIVGSGTTAAIRQYDGTGFVYTGTNGTKGTSGSGTSILTLGNDTAYTTNAGWKAGELRLYTDSAKYVAISGSGTAATSDRQIFVPDKSGTIALTSDIPSYTDTNTTYTLSGALSSHKFTSTLTPSSGTATTSDFTLAAGTGITITDTTSTRTMTIACSVTNTDTKVTQAYSTTSNSYPLLMTATAGISSTSSRGATTSILNNQIYANPSTGTITATAFNGAAMATTAYDTANLKNIVESTSDPGTASSYPTGTVWIKYTA